MAGPSEEVVTAAVHECGRGIAAYHSDKNSDPAPPPRPQERLPIRQCLISWNPVHLLSPGMWSWVPDGRKIRWTSPTVKLR
jgi:hypothetical protein